MLRSVLLLSDDIRLNTGVSTVSRYIANYLANNLNITVYQLAGGLQKHPEDNRMVKLTDKIVLFPTSEYGDMLKLRHIIENYKPDVLLYITDPHRWYWLYELSYEIRHLHNIPMVYYNVWDNPPTPYWNEHLYYNNDALIAISKVTYKINKETYYDNNRCFYVPHGVDENVFSPLDIENIKELRKLILEDKYNDNIKIVFWNNVNMLRKRPIDVLRIFEKLFDDNTYLIMKTQPETQYGTNLLYVIENYFPTKIANNIKIISSDISQSTMSTLYNVADLTINIAKNEGFGLSTLESMMCGTPAVFTKTGGLQDQIVDSVIENELVVEPAADVSIGHPQTPIIFEDIVSVNHVTNKIKNYFNKYNSLEKRKELGMLLRNKCIENELTAYNMCRKIYDILANITIDKKKKLVYYSTIS